MNDTMDTVTAMLNSAWQDLEHAINATYDEGYSALTWQLKHVQLQIENLETTIAEKEFGDDDAEY